MMTNIAGAVDRNTVSVGDAVGGCYDVSGVRAGCFVVETRVRIDDGEKVKKTEMK